MFEGTTFGRQVDLLQRGLAVSTLRQNVIADNIANANTPGFKRSDVNFESRLRYALDSETRPARFTEALTDERHVPFRRPLDWRDVRPRRVLDFQTTSQNNGNNVDIEVESMNFLTNQIAYQMMTRSVADAFQRLNIVLR